MDRYEIDIYWSGEDACFVAVIPELEGCVAHGASPEQALDEVTTARNLWLEGARSAGRDIPEPRSRPVAACG
ncbi:MAG TPA: type II toxin-antitoxin system HicB family antitoxin [Coriobacteriia bacterium]